MRAGLITSNPDEVLKETIDLSENMLKKSLKLMNQSKTTKFLRIIKTNYI